MPFRSLEDLAAHYDEGIAAGATPAEAVGWKVAHSQLANFIALTRVEGLASGASVLDVGCGLGALKDHLDAAGIAVDYTGIDIGARMIAEARARHPGLRFERRDILTDPPDERFDFVLCSGAMNLLLDDHASFVARMIRAMYGLCRRALSFNLLSAQALARNPFLQRTSGRYFYAWPEQVLRFCSRLSPLVSVDHAARATTFTVHVYRRNPAPAERYLAHAGLGPRYDDAARAVVEYYSELGLDAEAEALLERLEPSAGQLMQLAGLRAARGDEAGCRALFERAAELDPTSPWPHIARARLAFRVGRLDEAVDHLGRARMLAPGHPSVIETEVQLAIAHGRRADAAAAAATLPAGVLRDYLLGITAASPDEAEPHLRRAVEQAPALVDALVRLARIAERRGDSALAETFRGRARAVAPDAVP
jgi:SAM-dependent methyltransferase